MNIIKVSKIASFLFMFSISLLAQKETDFIKISNDSIFYQLKGNGNKTILFLAGGPGGAPESLKPIIEYLSENNKTILLHQRGTGLSIHNQINNNTISLDQYISDIDNVLKKVNESEVYILGHSWGAMLALNYTVKNPEKVKGLILIGAPGFSLDFVQNMNNAIYSRMTVTERDSLQFYLKMMNMDKLTKESITNKIGKMTLSKQFYNSSLVSELMVYGSFNQQVNMLMMNNLFTMNWNLEKECEQITTPTIIINGDSDPIDKKYVESLNEKLKFSNLYIIENCGHYVWIEKPQELKNLIEGFLLNK